MGVIVSGKALNFSNKVHAYQVLRAFESNDHGGALRAGDMVQLTEDSSKWFEPTCVVRLRSVRDLRIIPA